MFEVKKISSAMSLRTRMNRARPIPTLLAGSFIRKFTVKRVL